MDPPVLIFFLFFLFFPRAPVRGLPSKQTTMAIDRTKIEGNDPLSLFLDNNKSVLNLFTSISGDDDKNSDEGDISSPAVSEGDGIVLQPARSSNSTTTLEKWRKIINQEPQLLTGETKTLDNIACSLNTLAGGLIQGSLSMTNYRLIFIPSSENLRAGNLSESQEELCCLHLGLSYYQVPLGSIHKIEKSERKDIAQSVDKGVKVTALFLIIHCKDCRTLKLQLPVCEDSWRSIDVIHSFAYASDIMYLFAFEHKIHPSLVSVVPFF
jgi:hypothetical protein